MERETFEDVHHVGDAELGRPDVARGPRPVQPAGGHLGGQIRGKSPSGVDLGDPIVGVAADPLGDRVGRIAHGLVFVGQSAVHVGECRGRGRVTPTVVPMTSTALHQWLPDGAPELAPSADLADARATIASLTPGSGAPRRHQADVLRFIDEHPDALHRSCLVGHLTASAWVVSHDGGRGLVMYHSKIQRWVQPGGHADGDANLAAVALKEASEESGIDGLMVWSEPIDIDIHLFVNRKQTEPDHLHHDLRFLVRAPEGALASGNHESEELRWITRAELHDDDLALDASTIRLAESGFTVAQRLS